MSWVEVKVRTGDVLKVKSVYSLPKTLQKQVYEVLFGPIEHNEYRHLFPVMLYAIDRSQQSLFDSMNYAIKIDFMRDCMHEWKRDFMIRSMHPKEPELV